MTFEESKAYCAWLNRGLNGATILPSTQTRTEAENFLAKQRLTTRTRTRMALATAKYDLTQSQYLYNLSLLSSDPEVVGVKYLWKMRGFGVSCEREVWEWSERNGGLIHRDHFSRNWGQRT